MNYLIFISILITCCARGQGTGVAESGTAQLAYNLRSTKIPGRDYTNNLRGWFPLDDGSGSTTRNIMGTGNGALSNSPSWVATGHVRPTALRFSSPNGQSVLLPSAISVAGLSTVTKMVWAKFTTATTSNRVIAYESTGTAGASRYTLNQTAPTNFNAAYRDSNAGGAVNTTAPAANPTNTWIHFAVVVDAAADRISLYTNGILAITNLVVIGPMTADASADPLRLGYYIAGNPLSFDGEMQEFRVYTNAMTGGQVWQAFTKGNEPYF